MNNLRKILGSQPKQQRQFGLLIMIAGIAGFIISMSYFALFGKQIECNAIFVSKAIIRAVRHKLHATAFPFGKAAWQN